MILELKGIYKEYQQGKMKVPVLKDVNFSMEEGEYVAIMGPSDNEHQSSFSRTGWTQNSHVISFIHGENHII